MDTVDSVDDEAGQRPATILLPYPAAVLGDLPGRPGLACWDGSGPPPGRDLLAAVEFFVIPHTFTAVSLPLLAHLPRLRLLQSLSAGVDNVLPHLPSGAVLCNAKGVHDAGTAELALALTLASLRGIPGFVRAQQAGHWQGGFHPALADRTVLLIGHGAIGRAVEARLAPFECEVLRVARSARTGPTGRVHALEDLPALLPRADVVILTVPLTEDTRGLVGREFLAGLRDGALLVNVARGAVVDSAALLVELEARRISAALDTTDPEPLPPGHPLWRAPNLLISPHVGGTSSAFHPRALRLVRTQLRRFLDGEPPVNVVATGGR